MPDLKPFHETSEDHLRLVIETGHIGIWELDLGTGHAARNRIHDEIFGYSEPLDEWTYEQFLEHVVPEDREAVDAAQQRALAEKREWVFDCRINRGDGRRCWIHAAGRPLLGKDGQPVKIIGHVIDITDTKRKEERLELLTEELNHRVRNMLAMITSMVNMSASKAADVASFRRALIGRVGALSRSQDLVISDASVSLRPSEILHSELDVYPELVGRVDETIEGEGELSGYAGQGLALVFHELITNALKYGAFSTDEGRVSVRIVTHGDVLSIDWEEQGGPRGEPEKGQGFGTRLISGALGHHAKVTLKFPPEGARCHIEMPLAPQQNQHD